MLNQVKIPIEHFNKSVKAQYQDWQQALIRELIQNSVDAGATRLDIEQQDNWIMASDNGCGMTLEQFEKFYINLGGTNKSNRQSRGAFGSAKELISYAWEEWFVTSKDFYCKGTGSHYENPIEIDGIDGFQVYAKHDDFKHVNWEHKIRFIMLLSNIPMDVYFNDKKIRQGRKLEKASVLVKDNELYIVSSRKNSAENEGWLVVRAAGLFMFTCYFGGKAGSLKWYLDVGFDSIGSLSQSRDALKYDISQEITEIMGTTNKKSERVQPRIELFLAKEQVVMSEATHYTDADEKVFNSEPVIAEKYYENDVVIRATGKSKGAYISGNYWDIVQNLIDNPFNFAFGFGYKQKVNFLDDNGRLKYPYVKKFSLVKYILNRIITAMNESDYDIKSDTFIPGILYDKEADAASTNINGWNIICVRPTILDNDHPNYIIAIVLHELSHYFVDSEGIEFEGVRMELEKIIAPIRQELTVSIDAIQ